MEKQEKTKCIRISEKYHDKVRALAGRTKGLTIKMYIEGLIKEDHDYNSKIK